MQAQNNILPGVIFDNSVLGNDSVDGQVDEDVSSDSSSESGDDLSDNESGSSDGEDDDDNKSYNNDEFVFNNCLRQLGKDVSIRQLKDECSTVTKLGIWFGIGGHESNGDNVNWEKDGDFIVQNTQLKILKINARQISGSYYQSIHFVVSLLITDRLYVYVWMGSLAIVPEIIHLNTIFGMLRLWIDLVDVLNI